MAALTLVAQSGNQAISIYIFVLAARGHLTPTWGEEPKKCSGIKDVGNVEISPWPYLLENLPRPLLFGVGVGQDGQFVTELA